MFRRYLSLSPWKRRLLALAVGIAIGAAATAAFVLPQRAELRRFRDDWVAAQRSHDVAKLAALFDWDGVPAETRGRMKLALQQEADADVVAVRLEPLLPGDGAPLETIDGRTVPNLAPVCRLSVTFGGSGAGFSTRLVGRSRDGYRIVVYRPEKP